MSWSTFTCYLFHRMQPNTVICNVSTMTKEQTVFCCLIFILWLFFSLFLFLLELHSTHDRIVLLKMTETNWWSVCCILKACDPWWTKSSKWCSEICFQRLADTFERDQWNDTWSLAVLLSELCAFVCVCKMRKNCNMKIEYGAKVLSYLLKHVQI